MSKFSVEDLESLALWLDKCGDVSKAKALEYVQHNDSANVDRQMARHRKLSDYAETCREAATRLRVRAKRGVFLPPTLDAVLHYAKELEWPIDDAKAWYDYFEANGWRMKSGKMLDWRAAARNGHRRWKEKAPGRTPNESKDPDRWREFLRSIGRKYEAFGATPYLKTEFNQWLKTTSHSKPSAI